MNANTLKSIINAFKVAGTDPFRASLENVRIESCGENVKIVACNGHHLSIKTVEDKELAEKFTTPLYVHRGSIPALKAILKDAKSSSYVDSRAVDVGLSIGNGAISVVFESKDKDFYPNYEQVIPKKPDETEKTDKKGITFGVNPQLLVNLLTALKNSPHNGAVKLTVFSPTEAILVNVGEDTGVVMPMRI